MAGLYLDGPMTHTNYKMHDGLNLIFRAVGVAALVCFAGLIQGEVSELAESDLSVSEPDRMTVVHGCWGDEQGRLSGGQFLVPDTLGADEPGSIWDDRTRGFDGVDNRVDLVIVGDGYTAGEMGQFQFDAQVIEANFFAYEPFIRYQPYFRVTRVEVVSNESGVDNDPSQGIDRDTALDMEYWCGNIERLLCVNVGKARSFAQLGAPDVDQILAIANSSKYGGAGYSSNNLGTAAGQNSAAVDIAIHEMGHSLGNLADEYTYGGPAAYPGDESSSWNLSILNAAEMDAADSKWFRWLNASLSGFDNPVSSYEGGGYSVTGIYRPSNNSMMRNLGRRFNLPGAERLIREFYREVSPIDEGPSAGASFGAGEVIGIVPMRPAGQALRIEWIVDGVSVSSVLGSESVTAGDLGLGAGEHEVEVRVVDDTPWVRSQSIIDNVLTDSRVYQVTGCAAYADFNGDRTLDLSDLNAFASGFVSGDLVTDLAMPAGVLDLADILAFVDAFTGGCF